MPRTLVVAIVLVCVAAAPAAASSTRSDARTLAAALDPHIVLTPAQREAVVSDYEARAAQVSAGCGPTAQAMLLDEESDARFVLPMLYFADVVREAYAVQLAWSRAIDARLARLDLKTPVLRRARTLRRHLTASIADLWPPPAGGFCAVAAAWQASGAKATPPAVLRIARALKRMDDMADGRGERVFDAAERLLTRAGANRAQRRALVGLPIWPHLRTPAPDPFLEGANNADSSLISSGSASSTRPLPSSPASLLTHNLR